MFDWYMKKLDEFIQVSQYCHHSILEAHMVLARSATQDYLGNGDPESKISLSHVIRLTAAQAKHDGLDDTAEQLLSVAANLNADVNEPEDAVVLEFPSYRSNTA